MPNPFSLVRPSRPVLPLLPVLLLLPPLLALHLALFPAAPSCLAAPPSASPELPNPRFAMRDSPHAPGMTFSGQDIGADLHRFVSGGWGYDADSPSLLRPPANAGDNLLGLFVTNLQAVLVRLRSTLESAALGPSPEVCFKARATGRTLYYAPGERLFERIEFELTCLDAEMLDALEASGRKPEEAPQEERERVFAAMATIRRGMWFDSTDCLLHNAALLWNTSPREAATLLFRHNGGGPEGAAVNGPVKGQGGRTGEGPGGQKGEAPGERPGERLGALAKGAAEDRADNPADNPGDDGKRGGLVPLAEPLQRSIYLGITPGDFFRLHPDLAADQERVSGGWGFSREQALRLSVPAGVVDGPDQEAWEKRLQQIAFNHRSSLEHAQPLSAEQRLYPLLVEEKRREGDREGSRKPGPEQRPEPEQAMGRVTEQTREQGGLPGAQPDPQPDAKPGAKKDREPTPAPAPEPDDRSGPRLVRVVYDLYLGDGEQLREFLALREKGDLAALESGLKPELTRREAAMWFAIGPEREGAGYPGQADRVR